MMYQAKPQPADCCTRALLISGLFLVTSMQLIGCSDPPPPPPVAVDPGPPPPPPPPPCALDQLRVELQISDKIRLSQAEAPPNCDERRNILIFFNAFVNGDADTLRQMMSSEDSLQLEAMINAGQFEPAIEEIRQVTLETGISPQAQHCCLAMYLIGDGYEAQLWYYAEVSGVPTFSAAPQPPNIVGQLSGTDLVESWFAVLEREREIASELDDEVDDLGGAASSGGSSSSNSGGGGFPGGAPPTGPIGPGGRPGGPVGPGGPSPTGPINPGRP
jgi:hypothetical protein